MPFPKLHQMPEEFESLRWSEKHHCAELGIRLMSAYKLKPVEFIRMIAPACANVFQANPQMLIDLSTVLSILKNGDDVDSSNEAYVRLGIFFFGAQEENTNDAATPRHKKRQKRDNLYVVLNEEEGVCKIGRSKRPLDRVKALSTGSHSTLKLVFWFKFKGSLEKQMHKLLADYKVKGEWFDASVLAIVDWPSIEGHTEP